MQLHTSTLAPRRIVRATRTSLLCRGLVQPGRGLDECLQRLLVYLLAFAKIDGAPEVAFETGIEEAGWILERGTLGKGHLHGALVGLARADDAIVRPHRDAPLPLLHHVGIGRLDQLP